MTNNQIIILVAIVDSIICLIVINQSHRFWAKHLLLYFSDKITFIELLHWVYIQNFRLFFHHLRLRLSDQWLIDRLFNSLLTVLKLQEVVFVRHLQILRTQRHLFDFLHVFDRRRWNKLCLILLCAFVVLASSIDIIQGLCVKDLVSELLKLIIN